MTPLEKARAKKLAQPQHETIVNHADPLAQYTAVYKKVTDCGVLSDGAYRTYMVLLGYDYHKGSAVFPGLDRLAAARGVTRRTIQAHITELHAAKLLNVERRGLGLTNQYELLDASAWTPAALAEWKISSHQQRMGNVLPLHGEDIFTSHKGGRKTSTNKEKGEAPPIPHGCGEWEEERREPLRSCDEPPYRAAGVSVGTLDAAVVKLAEVLGQDATTTFKAKWRKHVGRFLNQEPEADLYGCLRWMLTDPFWQEKRDMRRLTINHVLDRLDEWRDTGCPAVRPVKKQQKAAPTHQHPAAALSAPDAYSGGKFGLCQICGSRPCAPDCPQQEHPDPRAVGLPPFSTRGEGS